MNCRRGAHRSPVGVASHVDGTLDRVEAAARGDGNLLPPIVEAVEAYATLGEISNRLRKVFGLHAEAFSF